MMSLRAPKRSPTINGRTIAGKTITIVPRIPWRSSYLGRPRSFTPSGLPEDPRFRANFKDRPIRDGTILGVTRFLAFMHHLCVSVHTARGEGQRGSGPSRDSVRVRIDGANPRRIRQDNRRSLLQPDDAARMELVSTTCRRLGSWQ